MITYETSLLEVQEFFFPNLSHVLKAMPGQQYDLLLVQKLDSQHNLHSFNPYFLQGITFHIISFSQVVSGQRIDLRFSFMLNLT